MLHRLLTVFARIQECSRRRNSWSYRVSSLIQMPFFVARGCRQRNLNEFEKELTLSEWEEHFEVNVFIGI